MSRHDQWHENAIIYCFDIGAFAYADGDRVGDFTDLIRRLDYLSGLGVTGLWLMPFYPTPNRDNGFDVADYSPVDPRFGSMANFTEFVLEARERGINVIVDLVPNHTSDQHSWFQVAGEFDDCLGRWPRALPGRGHRRGKVVAASTEGKIIG
jgi:maltose alpha-D-glucosyltransferase/alpha-amylase